MRELAPTIGIMDNDRQALLAIASGLRKLLPDFRLLWAVDTATAAITRCTSRMTQPTVMLADMSMEDIAGIATCRTIRRETSNVAILAMSSFLLDTYASDAADAGTQGIVSKRDTRRIAKAIEAVAAGHTWNDASNPSLAFRSPPSAQAWVRSHKSVTLSSAQTQVVELCSQGHGVTQIAAAIGVSEATVKTHLARAKEKLGAKNRAELIAAWIRLRERQ